MAGDNAPLLSSAVSNGTISTMDSTQPLLAPEDSSELSRKETSRGDLEWNASMATWEATCRLPTTKDAHEYYRFMLPCALFMNVITLGGPIIFFMLVVARVLKAVDKTTFWLIFPFIVLSYLISPLLYIYHYFRLRGSQKLPPQPPRGPLQRRALTHAVVVVAYQEPTQVLKRTFASIAAQQGTGKRPIAVFAAEAHDSNRHAQAAILREAYGANFERFVLTEHPLRTGETAGKASNANHALRELKKITDAAGLHPFEVMVTVVDADSVLSATYLAHVENYFYNMPDGRRMIYNGPLNTYRNFGEAGLLIQMYEMQRCHADLYHNPFARCFPLSNYSLTLGFCEELDYWTPDNIPEDVHTSLKAIMMSYSSHTVVCVESIICNDLVSGVADRYVQAKRHHWGITETAYLLAVAKHMHLSFEVFLSFFAAELSRAGSFFTTCALVSGLVLKFFVVYVIYAMWGQITPEAKLIIYCILGLVPWSWLMFWIAEISFWRSPLMRQFDIVHASCCRWMILILLSPILSLIADVLFFMLPVLHILLHVACIGNDMEYVSAPKGKGDADDAQLALGKKRGTKAKERSNDSL